MKSKRKSEPPVLKRPFIKGSRVVIQEVGATQGKRRFIGKTSRGVKLWSSHSVITGIETPPIADKPECICYFPNPKPLLPIVKDQDFPPVHHAVRVHRMVWDAEKKQMVKVRVRVKDAEGHWYEMDETRLIGCRSLAHAHRVFGGLQRRFEETESRLKQSISEPLLGTPTDPQEFYLWEMFKDTYPKTYGKLEEAWKAKDKGKPDANVRDHLDRAAREFIKERKRLRLTKNRVKLEVVLNYFTKGYGKKNPVEAVKGILDATGIRMTHDAFVTMRKRLTFLP